MKKTLLLIIQVAALGLALSSCSGSSGQDFPFSIQNDQLNLLNASARSCRLQSDPTNFGTQPDDLTAPTMNIGKLSVTWTGKDVLVIDHVTITLKSDGFTGGQPSSQVIAGSDLAYLWWQTPGVGTAPPTTVTLNPPAVGGAPIVYSTNSLCSFAIGNIPLTDKTKSISGQGTILISGVYGNSTMQSRVDFTFNYVGENSQ